jgi:predicted nucleic acid-binding protein
LTVFADSSALVKLYADERGAEVVRAVPLFVVSAIARVEVPAAIWRKHRMTELSAEDAGVLTTAFEADWADLDGPFAVVALGGPVLDSAARLAARHGLRAYDAVQLASAVGARAADPEIDTLLCFDVDLSEAAAREGFAGAG